MRRAVVCFANVQEGRDPKILKELAAAASSVPLPYTDISRWLQLW